MISLGNGSRNRHRCMVKCKGYNAQDALRQHETLAALNRSRIHTILVQRSRLDGQKHQPHSSLKSAENCFFAGLTTALFCPDVAANITALAYLRTIPANDTPIPAAWLARIVHFLQLGQDCRLQYEAAHTLNILTAVGASGHPMLRMVVQAGAIAVLIQSLNSACNDLQGNVFAILCHLACDCIGREQMLGLKIVPILQQIMATTPTTAAQVIGLACRLIANIAVGGKAYVEELTCHGLVAKCAELYSTPMPFSTDALRREAAWALSACLAVGSAAQVAGIVAHYPAALDALLDMLRCPEVAVLCSALLAIQNLARALNQEDNDNVVQQSKQITEIGKRVEILQGHSSPEVSALAASILSDGAFLPDPDASAWESMGFW